MTKTVEEVRRELFESIWPMPSNCMRCGNTYAATSYNAWQAAEFIQRWEGFNKALDSIEIEPPYRYTDDCAALCKSSAAYNDCHDRFSAAIEQTGLGLRVK